MCKVGVIPNMNTGWAISERVTLQSEVYMGLQMDKMFNTNWKCMPEDQRANLTNRSIASRTKKVILPLCSTSMRLHLQYYVQPWGVSASRDMIRGLEHLFYEDMLRGFGLFDL